jgi:hypothetical protein
MSITQLDKKHCDESRLKRIEAQQRKHERNMETQTPTYEERLALGFRMLTGNPCWLLLVVCLAGCSALGPKFPTSLELLPEISVAIAVTAAVDDDPAPVPVPDVKPAGDECPDCDGNGWVGDGSSYKKTCQTCKGTGKRKVAAMAQSAPAAAIEYQTDLEAARALSRETGKPLWLHFMHDGCRPCEELGRHFIHPDVVTQSEMYVVLKVNRSTPTGRAIASEYGLASTTPDPLDIFDYGDGVKLLYPGAPRVNGQITLQAVLNRFAGAQLHAPKP